MINMKTRNFKFIGGFIVAATGFSAVTMLLWNALMPSIFSIATINFWQALGLLVLGRILFGGLGSGAINHLHDHHHNPVRERWFKMTPEERREFFRNHHRGMKHFAMEDFDEKRPEKENEQN